MTLDLFYIYATPPNPFHMLKYLKNSFSIHAERYVFNKDDALFEHVTMTQNLMRHQQSMIK